jgi:hypothetical protein
MNSIMNGACLAIEENEIVVSSTKVHVNSTLNGFNFQIRYLLQTVLMAAVRAGTAMLAMAVPKLPPQTLDEISLVPTVFEAPGTRRQS